MNGEKSGRRGRQERYGAAPSAVEAEGSSSTMWGPAGVVPVLNLVGSACRRSGGWGRRPRTHLAAFLCYSQHVFWITRHSVLPDLSLHDIYLSVFSRFTPDHLHLRQDHQHERKEYRARVRQ
jgi:hypothetical protein